MNCHRFLLPFAVAMFAVPWPAASARAATIVVASPLGVELDGAAMILEPVR
jgi:hypothetical protein